MLARKSGGMKLWLLRARNPVGWDCAEGFVVRAESEEAARALAQEAGGDERYIQKGRSFWIDPDLATCEELRGRGEIGVVLRDFRAG